MNCVATAVESEDGLTMIMTHAWRFRRWRPDRYGHKCRVIATGRGNVLVEFEDGERIVTIRWAIRRLPGG